MDGRDDLLTIFGILKLLKKDIFMAVFREFFKLPNWNIALTSE